MIQHLVSVSLSCVKARSRKNMAAPNAPPFSAEKFYFIFFPTASFSSISPISAAALSAFFVYIGMQSRLFFGSLPYRESPVSVSAGMA